MMLILLLLSEELHLEVVTQTKVHTISGSHQNSDWHWSLLWQLSALPQVHSAVNLKTFHYVKLGSLSLSEVLSYCLNSN